MSGEIRIVPNDQNYWEFIRSLRNNPVLKKGFIQQQDINNQDHSNYMKKNGSDYYICLVGENPVGFVGCVKGDIRVAILSDYMGRGLGKKMVQHIIKIYPLSQAKIKIDNESSLGLFESCGFKKKFYILEKE